MGGLDHPPYMGPKAPPNETVDVHPYIRELENFTGSAQAPVFSYSKRIRSTGLNGLE